MALTRHLGASALQIRSCSRLCGIRGLFLFLWEAIIAATNACKRTAFLCKCGGVHVLKYRGIGNAVCPRAWLEDFKPIVWLPHSDNSVITDLGPCMVWAIVPVFHLELPNTILDFKFLTAKVAHVV